MRHRLSKHQTRKIIAGILVGVLSVMPVVGFADTVADAAGAKRATVSTKGAVLQTRSKCEWIPVVSKPNPSEVLHYTARIGSDCSAEVDPGRDDSAQGLSFEFDLSEAGPADEGPALEETPPEQPTLEQSPPQIRRLSAMSSQAARAAAANSQNCG